MMHIKSIALQNFQVFGTLTLIPLSRLNLLYGPNSAGKSAVLDALGVFAALFPAGEEKNRFKTLNWNSFRSSREALLAPHWRRIKGDRLAPGPLIIEVEIWAPAGLWSSPSAFASSSLPPRILEGGTYRVRITQQQLEGDAGIAIDIHYNDLLFCSYEQFGYLEMPFACPLGLEENDRSFAAEYRRAAALPNSPFDIRGDHVRFNGHVALDDDLTMSYEEAESVALEDGAKHWDKRGTEIILEAMTLLIRRMNASLHLVLDGLSNSSPLRRVPASRAVPKRSELVYHFQDDDWVPSHATFVGYSATGDPQYIDLARAFAIDAREAYLRQLGLEPEQTGRLRHDVASSHKQVAKNVNRALCKYLIADRPYRLRGDVNYRVSTQALKSLATPSTVGEEKDQTYPRCPPIEVRLVLLDAADRQFDFEEVGSGLGYFLPVLAAVYSGDNAAIEQPELHLHPAVQANMSDVFLDALKGRNESQLIVETHSEHLLLRILRRIRETGSGKKTRRAQHCLPDDVSVLYFDPQKNGTTRVVRLRISEDGDFLDRWPKGFFAERDRELFDE